MKSLAIIAMGAALVVSAASAQTTHTDTAISARRDGAVERSAPRHVTRSERSTAGRRGEAAFATAPSERAARARAAAGAFDGNWSVLILTRSGGCDPSFRYGVEISNGEVLNAGGAPVSLEGHVAPSGAIQVSVAAGGQEAFGAGRLSRTTGTGTWRGQGSRGACAGTWEAERR